jgi:hypothetical protein
MQPISYARHQFQAVPPGLPLNLEGALAGFSADERKPQEHEGLRPSLPRALNDRCWYGALPGRLDGALDDCDDALDIAPKAASSLYGRELVKQQKGDKTAAADMEATKAIDPAIESHFAWPARGER